MRERHRRDADVLVVLEEDRHARPARIGDSVPVRRRPDHRAADDFDLMLRFQRVHRRLDGGEPQAEALRELRAGQLAREVHVLQRELKEQVERQAGLLEGYGRRPGAAAPLARRDVRKLISIYRLEPGSRSGPGLHRERLRSSSLLRRARRRCMYRMPTTLRRRRDR